MRAATDAIYKTSGKNYIYGSAYSTICKQYVFCSSYQASQDSIDIENRPSNKGTRSLNYENLKDRKDYIIERSKLCCENPLFYFPCRSNSVTKHIFLDHLGATNLVSIVQFSEFSTQSLAIFWSVIQLATIQVQ